MRQLRYAQSINEGLRQVMAEDPDVFILGEDIRHSLRGLTRGLAAEFSNERVVDMPISEAAFTGLATGAAMSGMRPVVEFQIGALAFVAFDQLVDQAMKLPYMMGGQCRVPVTYIFPASGFRTGLAGQHSDQLYTYLMQAGMKIVIPSDPSDAKGLLISAIRCDDPVAYFAPAALMPVRGPVAEEMFEVPIGKGAVRREGHGMTIVATGHLVNEALRVADELEGLGISLHVYDPRSLLPLDMEGLETAVRKTGRVIVFDDSNLVCGFAAEISALVAEHWFDALKAPVKRIARATIPVPFSPFLDKAVVPTGETLKRVVLALAERERADA